MRKEREHLLVYWWDKVLGKFEIRDKKGETGR